MSEIISENSNENLSQNAQGDSINELIEQIGFGDAPGLPSDHVTQDTAQEGGRETAVVEKTDPVDSDREKIAALERVIASNPDLRAAYIRQLYGAPEESPPIPEFIPATESVNIIPSNTPQLQELPMFPKGAELPEDVKFDPYNKEHMLSLIQQALNPFATYIQQQHQQEVQYQQAMAQQERLQIQKQANDQLHVMLDEQLPGIREMFQKQNPTFEEHVLSDFIHTTFKKAMQGYPKEVWLHPKAHQDVVLKIAPGIKQLAGKLGLAFNPADRDESAKASARDMARDMAREMYVESSHVTPARYADREFDMAHKAGNVSEMIRLSGLIP